MSDWKGSAPPPPFLAETHVRADTAANPYWAGCVVSNTNQGTFYHAEAWYYEATFYGSSCNTNYDVTWAGIGGWGTSYLGQDGTSHNLPGIKDHQAWWEVVPLNFVTPVSLYGHSGYLFDASTSYNSQHGWYAFYMQDYYSASSPESMGTLGQ